MNNSAFFQWLESFYHQNFPVFSLLFCLLLLLALIPGLGKRKGLAFYWLSIFSFCGWAFLPYLPEFISLTPFWSQMTNLGRSIFLSLSLLFFFAFYNRSFGRGKRLWMGISFLSISLPLLFLQILPQLYQLLRYVYMRKLISLLPYPWFNLLFALFFLFLLIRLLTGIINEDNDLLLSAVILMPALALGVFLAIWRENPADPMEDKLMLNLMPLLVFLSLWRWLRPSAALPAAKTEPSNERLLSQLEESRKALEKVQKDLAEEDTQMGRVLQKTRKLREALLPSEIHPDPFWEAAVFYQPERADNPDFYDFYYSYGKTLRGAAFYDIRNGMNGTFTGAWIKGIMPNRFNEASSLSTLFRDIHRGTEVFREGRELSCQLVRFTQKELEYTGWQNAPLLFRKANRKKSAALIQDPEKNWENLKSYRIQVDPGDAVVLANDLFYHMPNRVTEEPFGVERTMESLDKQEGKASEILQGLMRERTQFHNGEHKAHRGVFILVLRRKTTASKKETVQA